MDQTATLRCLREHEAELRGYGVQRLSLFGSMARKLNSEHSDIDVAVQLTEELRGFNRVRQLDALRTHLETLLSSDVDVVEEPVPSPRMQQAIDRDRIVAF